MLLDLKHMLLELEKDSKKYKDDIAYQREIALN